MGTTEDLISLVQLVAGKYLPGIVIPSQTCATTPPLPVFLSVYPLTYRHSKHRTKKTPHALKMHRLPKGDGLKGDELHQGSAGDLSPERAL